MPAITLPQYLSFNRPDQARRILLVNQVQLDPQATPNVLAEALTALLARGGDTAANVLTDMATLHPDKELVVNVYKAKHQEALPALPASTGSAAGGGCGGDCKCGGSCGCKGKSNFTGCANCPSGMKSNFTGAEVAAKVQTGIQNHTGWVIGGVAVAAFLLGMVLMKKD